MSRHAESLALVALLAVAALVACAAMLCSV